MQRASGRRGARAGRRRACRQAGPCRRRDRSGRRRHVVATQSIRRIVRGWRGLDGDGGGAAAGELGEPQIVDRVHVARVSARRRRQRQRPVRGRLEAGDQERGNQRDAVVGDADRAVVHRDAQRHERVLTHQVAHPDLRHLHPRHPHRQVRRLHLLQVVRHLARASEQQDRQPCHQRRLRLARPRARAQRQRGARRRRRRRRVGGRRRQVGAHRAAARRH